MAVPVAHGLGIQLKNLAVAALGTWKPPFRFSRATPRPPPGGGMSSSPPTIRAFHSNRYALPKHEFFAPFLKYSGGWRSNIGGGIAYVPERLARLRLRGLVPSIS
jgi:hypothetical protein